MSVRTQFTFRVWLALLALGAVLWILAEHARALFTVLGVLFGALLLSLSIRPLADRLSRRSIPRGVTVLGVYLGLAGILALIVILILPMVSSEIRSLQDEGPQLLEKIYNWLSGIPGVGQAIPSNGGLLQTLTTRLQSLLGGALGLAASIGHLLLNVLIAIVLSYFFTTGADMSDHFIDTWVPRRRRREARLLLGRVAQRLSRWVWAQAAIGLYLGVTYGLALFLLGVPFAFTIGVIGGVLEIIPYFGAGTALVLGVLSALSSEPIKALWVLIAFTVLVEFKGHVIEPNLYGRVIGLHPAAVVVALLIGGEAGGIIGMLFSVPVASVVVTVMQEVRESRGGSAAAEAGPGRKGDDHRDDRAAV
jgi:predicted PurR-regulated permease PerM